MVLEHEDTPAHDHEGVCCGYWQHSRSFFWLLLCTASLLQRICILVSFMQATAMTSGVLPKLPKLPPGSPDHYQVCPTLHEVGRLSSQARLPSKQSKSLLSLLAGDSMKQLRLFFECLGDGSHTEDFIGDEPLHQFYLLTIETTIRS